MDFDALAGELRGLREGVADVTGAILAAVDGILIFSDTAKGVDPAKLSALGAANLGIARQVTEVTGKGILKQTVVFSSAGYMAVYAVGRFALLIVLGDRGLNIGRLLFEAGQTTERIAAILAK